MLFFACWQLDQMTISFDGGKTMMNFAEAALLIQGSTCIYGRKVKMWNIWGFVKKSDISLVVHVQLVF